MQYAALGAAALDAASQMYTKYSSWKNSGVRKPWRGSFKRKGLNKYRRIACRPEMHMLDVNLTPLLPAVGGSTQCINQIAAGTDFYQRNGRNIVARYIQYDFCIAPPTAVSAYDQYVIAIVYDKTPANTAIAYNQVFDITTLPVGLAFRNIATWGDRFKILKEFRGHTSQGSPALPVQ